MEDTQSVASLLQSTTSKIQQLQKAFAELESHRAITLNLKWKQIEDHFHGLEKSLKRRFTELEDQENEFKIKTTQSQKLLETRQSAVIAKEEASLQKLQEKRDLAVAAITGGTPMVEEKPPPPPPPPPPLELTLTNPQLAKLCKENDVAGLHKFISDNRKNLATIKEEIPVALQVADDPGGFVLDSVSGFYNLVDGKKDANLLGQRRTCIMLMECLSVLLENVDGVYVKRLISENVKERAKGIADEWKPKLDDLDLDASNGNSLEAHAFLQLVATFGIDSCFVKEDLIKLVPMVARRHQTADLCRFLGLSEKMPGVIDVLVNSGRHIDAVNLAFAFELTEKFSPVSLLKSYLTEARRVPSLIKSGNLSPAQNDVSERELSALKTVIKCIEEHKLEDQYPVGPLQKRILQLEKAKADKKRATEVAKPQPKRPRANGISPVYAPPPRNTNTDKNFYPRMSERYAPAPTPQSQYVYDNRPYGYAVQPDTHMGAYMGTPAYNMGPNHAHYFATGYQYQAAYMH
ncbi:hypothetical protein Lser_V15G39256 [Lactuca serriola]